MDFGANRINLLRRFDSVQHQIHTGLRQRFVCEFSLLGIETAEFARESKIGKFYLGFLAAGEVERGTFTNAGRPTGCHGFQARIEPYAFHSVDVVITEE